MTRKGQYAVAVASVLSAILLILRPTLTTGQAENTGSGEKDAADKASSSGADVEPADFRSRTELNPLLAKAIGFTADRVSADLQNLHTLYRILQRYYDELGRYPAEDPTEMLAALRGKNRKNMRFVIDGSQSAKLLVDARGRQLSISLGTKRDEISIRSCGVDGEFETGDDVYVPF